MALRHLRTYLGFCREHVHGLSPRLRFLRYYPAFYASARRVAAGKWRDMAVTEAPEEFISLRVDLGRPVDIVLPRRLDAYTAFEDIFFLEDYRPQASIRNPRTFVDLGANYGLATCFFASLYDLDRILAVEPNPHCAAVLQQNLSCRPGLRAIHVPALVGSVEDGEGSLALSSHFVLARSSEYSFDERPTTGIIRNLRRARLSSLLREQEIEQVDVLKIDVEFAEYDLTRHDPEGLRACRCIIGEIHGKPPQRRELMEEWRKLGFSILPSRHISADHEIVEAHREGP